MQPFPTNHDVILQRKQQLRLLLISIAGLYFELLIIRWLATEVRIFAYFKNMALMAAFLGLSLGFMRAGNKLDLYRWSGVAFLCLGGILALAPVLGLTHLSFVAPGADVMLFGEFAGLTGVTVLKALLAFVGIFSLNVFFFAGLGQETGRLFLGLPPLRAYSINVLGGLVGILLFSLASALCTGPATWLVLAGMLFFLLDRKLIASSIVLVPTCTSSRSP
jgi:hypothetical protein